MFADKRHRVTNRRLTPLSATGMEDREQAQVNK